MQATQFYRLLQLESADSQTFDGLRMFPGTLFYPENVVYHLQSNYCSHYVLLFPWFSLVTREIHSNRLS